LDPKADLDRYTRATPIEVGRDEGANDRVITDVWDGDGDFVLADPGTNSFYRLKPNTETDQGGAVIRRVFDLEKVGLFDIVSSLSCEGRVIMGGGDCGVLGELDNSLHRGCGTGFGLNWAGATRADGPKQQTLQL
jgi:hypothetical protein